MCVSADKGAAIADALPCVSLLSHRQACGLLLLFFLEARVLRFNLRVGRVKLLLIMLFELVNAGRVLLERKGHWKGHGATSTVRRGWAQSTHAMPQQNMEKANERACASDVRYAHTHCTCPSHTHTPTVPAPRLGHHLFTRSTRPTLACLASLSRSIRSAASSALRPQEAQSHSK